jgi:decaprenylphospho-beta-D-erythro-pentofuranosid-2-ulose 2-reductase
VKVVVVGATRGMGRALSRLLAARGEELFLLGRDAGELARSAADLEQRGAKGHVGFAPCDLLEPETFGPALDAADAAMGGFTTAILTAGLFGTQDQLEQDEDLLRAVLVANGAHTILLCEMIRKRLLARGGGTLCVFSSVAGDRGRKTVGLYGATKAALSHYLEALDHKYRAAGLVTVCVKPGFVHTDMTAGLKPPPFAGQPEAVAQRVLSAIDRGKPLVYAPGIWALVMAVIRRLPRFVMRRVGF